MPAFARIAIFSLLLCIGIARADSWRPPQVETYTSTDGNARVTITPRPLGGALPYFQDKVSGKEPAGQRAGSDQVHPLATLERREAGRWRTVWTVPLVNDVGPVHALVANGGRHLVTFDNWHSAGFGPDVVVIYDGEGQLIRKLALKDFLPEAYVALLPRTVSSLWWSGDHVLADGDNTLVLRVVEPSEDADLADEPPTAPVRIRLVDGQVLPYADTEWQRAIAKVNVLDQKRHARWREKRALRARPLLPPAGTDYDAWREYLVELRERLNDATGKQHAGLVLSITGDDDHNIDSAEGITTFLEEFSSGRSYAPEAYVFVSPSSRALADLLAEYLASVKPGSMKGATVRFLGTVEDGDRVKTAAAPSGSEIVVIDNATSFPPGNLPEAVPEWFQ